MICLQIIHLKRFQFVNGHWVKSNKIVQFPMQGFDPSAFLAKQSTHTNGSTSASDSGVTTVHVKSSGSEEQETDEENGEKTEQTSRQGSEVKSCQFYVSVNRHLYRGPTQKNLCHIRLSLP